MNSISASSLIQLYRYEFKKFNSRKSARFAAQAETQPVARWGHFRGSYGEVTPKRRTTNSTSSEQRGTLHAAQYEDSPSDDRNHRIGNDVDSKAGRIAKSLFHGFELPKLRWISAPQIEGVETVGDHRDSEQRGNWIHQAPFFCLSFF